MPIHYQKKKMFLKSLTVYFVDKTVENPSSNKNLSTQIMGFL